MPASDSASSRRCGCSGRSSPTGPSTVASDGRPRPRAEATKPPKPNNARVGLGAVAGAEPRFQSCVVVIETMCTTQLWRRSELNWSCVAPPPRNRQAQTSLCGRTHVRPGTLPLGIPAPVLIGQASPAEHRDWGLGTIPILPLGIDPGLDDRAPMEPTVAEVELVLEGLALFPGGPDSCGLRAVTAVPRGRSRSASRP